MKLLFLGDVFGNRAITKLQLELPELIKEHNIDFVVVQGENASGRKGLVPSDYEALKNAGVNAFTMGNHVWAKDDILNIIGNPDIIRPFNVEFQYPGRGTRVFKVKDETLRITQFMGITFNHLNKPWKEDVASNFFDAFDEIQEQFEEDYHLIDFHAETTSEKNVFGLYVDGKASAFVGTHTHVQTADERILPKGTAYITDVGSVGPINSAIGASYDTVYQKMRYDAKVRFEVSNNEIQINGVVITLEKGKATSIERINK